MPVFEEQDEVRHFVIMKDTPVFLNVTFGNNGKLPVVQMRQKPAVAGQTIPVGSTARALGLKGDDLSIDGLVPTVVQTEVAHTMVPVKNLQLLNSCVPDNVQLIKISKKYRFEGFYCFTFTQDREHIAEARFFNPLIGIDEDAATGTAAGPLAGFLADNRYIQPNREYKILQGVKLNRPSSIEVMVREQDILVGDTSTLTMRGQIYL